VKPWNVLEVQTFVRGVSDERLYAPLLLSLMGLRPAEVCGLRWVDVDLDNATITIANTRTMMGNRRVVEKDTKSLAGERALPLPAVVLAALKSFKALQAKEKLALGEAYADSGYVLVHETGEAFTIKQLRRRAYRLMEILGLRAFVSTTLVRRASRTWQTKVCRITSLQVGRTHEREDHEEVVCEAGCRGSSRSRHNMGWIAWIFDRCDRGASVSAAAYQPSDLPSRIGSRNRESPSGYGTVLEAVTGQEALGRRDWVRARARRTHCRHGHAYTPENSYVDPRGFRQCRACRSERGKSR
jgi:hypothetical protein